MFVASTVLLQQEVLSSLIGTKTKIFYQIRLDSVMRCSLIKLAVDLLFPTDLIFMCMFSRLVVCLLRNNNS